jgi:signal transduction histidine kinase
VIITVVLLSIFFYQQFKEALDERVLLQLTSIKRLKRVQIEEYINNEWKVFSDSVSRLKPSEMSQLNVSENTLLVDTTCLKSQLINTKIKTGIYDISDCSIDSQPKIAFVVNKDDFCHLKIINTTRIQSILLERTGMGSSGETYLVGEDYHLRSESRFFPDKAPIQITAKTKGVISAVEGENGHGIFNDYRGIPVYSAYHKLEIPNLNWVILSEIDVEEVIVPLKKMRNNLILISVLVLLLAIMLSFFISTILSKPLFKMRNFLNSMSKGKYDFEIKNTHPVQEIKEMFVALEKLRTSINEAMHFSTQIGEMNLNATYQLSSEDDLLGKSLIRMQKKLTAYERAETNSRLSAKKSLIVGQEKERERLSRELHDGLGPLLTSLKLVIQSTELSTEEKKKVAVIVDDTISEIRRMTYDLMPSALVDFGVGKALTNFVELIQKSSGISIIYEDGTKETRTHLINDLGICVFRVCQELVNNSLKHSQAKKIVISLTEFDDKVSLYYVDNGKGFDPKTVNRGLGLRNIEERVEVFNGYLNIRSGSYGTEIELEIPIEHE